VKDLEGQIQSLSGSTTPHSDDSQADKPPPVDPATVTNLVSVCGIKIKLLSRFVSGKEIKGYILEKTI
jgi:hypothetical protein